MTSYASQHYVLNPLEGKKVMCSQQDSTFDVFAVSFSSNSEESVSVNSQQQFLPDNDDDDPLSEISVAVKHIQCSSSNPVSPLSDFGDSDNVPHSRTSGGSFQISEGMDSQISFTLNCNPGASQVSSSGESETESDFEHFEEIFVVDSQDDNHSLVVEHEVMDDEELSTQNSKELSSTYSSEVSNVDPIEEMDTSIFYSDDSSEASGSGYTKTRTISYVSSNAESTGSLDSSSAASQLSYQTATSETSNVGFKAPFAKKRVRFASDVDTSYSSAMSSQPGRLYGKRLKPMEEIKVGGIIWSFGNDMFCLTEHSLEIYDYMRLKESSNPLSHFFLSRQKEVTEDLRRAVVCKLLCNKPLYKLSELTTHLAIYILDKCLDSFHIAVRLLQDVAAVCLVIASKIEDYNCFRMADLIRLDLSTQSDKSFLSAIEKKIMIELDFQFSYATPFSYAGYYLVHLEASPIQIVTSYYLLELALLDSRLRNYSGSGVAHAVVCLAHSLSPPDGESSLQSLQNTERRLSVASSIAPCSTRNTMQMILGLMTNETDEFDAVRAFYREEGTLRVSDLLIPLDLMEAVSVGGSRRNGFGQL